MAVGNGRRIVRFAAAAVVAAAISGTFITSGLDSQFRPFTIHTTPALSDALTEHPALDEEFRFYTDLRTVAAWHDISLPASHPLDVEALTWVSLVNVTHPPADGSNERTDARSLGPPLSGRVHTITDDECRIFDYHFDRSVEEGAPFRAWFDEGVLIVAGGDPVRETVTADG